MNVMSNPAVIFFILITSSSDVGPHSRNRYPRLLGDDLSFTLDFVTAVTKISHSCYSSYPHS